MKLSIITILLCCTCSVFGSDLPLSIQAKISRIAEIIWHSKEMPNGENSSKIAVMYRTPVVGANDACSYIEIFLLDEDGSSESLDRIYLGGRGVYNIDKVSDNGKVITINAREHGDHDSIANPTINVNITIDYNETPILISKTYPSKNKEAQQAAPRNR
jgi:hypothetical protein